MLLEVLPVPINMAVSVLPVMRVPPPSIPSPHARATERVLRQRINLHSGSVSILLYVLLT